MPRRLATLIAVAVALVALAGCDASDATRPAPPDERRAAPELVLPRLDGRGELRLAEYRGRPVVLNFWASWCEPCREEMPALARFARDQRRVAVVGVAVNDAPARSRAFARRAGVGFPLAVDREAGAAGRFGVSGLPVTVFIDAEGRIVRTVRGVVTEADLRGAADGA
ncbi:MAG TPA: TlpA disulfide reductase family protein, partial [Miltoncostaeaceae bacterium]|nr:TlpA disulfide reductase family protein [Miltoncostaeaceae bacterium]